MKKQYRVMGFSSLMDVEMNCATPEHANEILDLLSEGGQYYKGYIMDNYTGEVYCGFDRADDEYTERLTFWATRQ